jgi:hypothetical protein
MGDQDRDDFLNATQAREAPYRAAWSPDLVAYCRTEGDPSGAHRVGGGVPR